VKRGRAFIAAPPCQLLEIILDMQIPCQCDTQACRFVHGYVARVAHLHVNEGSHANTRVGNNSLRLDWKTWKLPYQFSRLTCCHATPCCISSVSGILIRCRPHKALRKQAFCRKVKADASLHAYVGTGREGSAR
jgi:hypothetical protein